MYIYAHHRFTENLVKQIKSTIRKELSARHVPNVVLEIADIPVSYFILMIIFFTWQYTDVVVEVYQISA